MVKLNDTFSIRAAEHVISYLTEESIKNVKKQAISDHHLQCDCLASFDHFNNLASDKLKIDFS